MKTLLLVNVLGGIAVLGSYAWCIGAYPDQIGDFWGEVPLSLRPVYTLNMALAALGYFAFTFFVVFRFSPRPGSAVRLGTFTGLYALILAPSALWMPLTFAMLDAPSQGLWWLIRLTLFAVGAGSLGLLACLVASRPDRPTAAHRLAVAGGAFFCLQTALLDALVWPAYFPVQVSGAA